jgi:hypothetical protein
MGSLLVRYIRAKGESVGGEGCDVGIAERRSALSYSLKALGLVDPAMIVADVLANLTAVWRVFYIIIRI